MARAGNTSLTDGNITPPVSLIFYLLVNPSPTDVSSRRTLQSALPQQPAALLFPGPFMPSRVSQRGFARQMGLLAWRWDVKQASTHAASPRPTLSMPSSLMESASPLLLRFGKVKRESTGQDLDEGQQGQL